MIDTWYGEPRKVIGDTQAVVSKMTIGKGRICIGPVDSPCYDHGY